MTNTLEKAIETVQKAELSFSKYITANDTGKTGGHQNGFHISKNLWPLFFDKEGQKGENKDHFITIKWQDDFETNSRFIYYGRGTRNEYRLTRFGKNFPFLNEENTGDLLVFSKISNNYYKAFVLSQDEEIEDFLTSLNISSHDLNKIIPKQFYTNSADKILNCFQSFINDLTIDFPSTNELAKNARICYNSANNITENLIKKNPDKELLAWLEAEFQLFKKIEKERYFTKIQKRFETVEDLIETANTILNRRKSRAGKSLEHHLTEIFSIFGLLFSTQAYTEERKKPDFIFPGEAEYKNPKFNSDKLVILAAKTTCKDRWRQILSEADRVKTKHLFTLQQGISSNQLKEMKQHNVQLVVPQKHIDSFPKEFQNQIYPLKMFIKYVASKQL